MKTSSKSSVRLNKWLVAFCVAFGASGTTGVAHAISIDTGDTGVDLRWDNTFRYNIGVRVEPQQSVIEDNVNYDESDSKFKQGQLVTSRLDLLSELDGTYQTGFGRIGARVSGAGWYDPAYDDKVQYNPDITQSESDRPDLVHDQTSYNGDKYSAYTRRFYLYGGELLDAFVFLNSNIIGMPVSVKAGRSSQYWGESLFFANQSVSYSQQPVDGLKASTSPGIETKEVFVPLTQISMTLQPIPELTLAAQYFLEWQESRFPEGGTYFGVSDFLFQGPDRFPLLSPGEAKLLNAIPDCDPATCTFGHFSNTPAVQASATRVGYNKPDGTDDYGANARWSPDWLKGTLGLYYRHFDDRSSWSGLNLGNVAIIKLPAIAGGGIEAIPTTYSLVYPKNTKLYGLSYTRDVGTASVAGEVSYRQDQALNNALPSYITGSSFGADGQGPRGNIMSALVNTVYLMPKTPLWDTGTVIAEMAWSHLTSVTDNPEEYSAKGYAGCNPSGLPGGAAGGTYDGCSTRNFLGAQMNVEPQWLQVRPGIDLSMPVSYFVGILGNKQDNGDGFQGEMRYSAGFAADIHQKYKITMAFNDSYAHVGASEPFSTRDRGWVSLTAKASF